MISYVKTLSALAVIAFAGSVFVGCSGFSKDDATDRCKQEQDARQASCFTNGSFDSCLAAFEDCGDSARADQSSCPLVYKCGDEVKSGEGGGGGSGSTTSATTSSGK